MFYTRCNAIRALCFEIRKYVCNCATCNNNNDDTDNDNDNDNDKKLLVKVLNYVGHGFNIYKLLSNVNSLFDVGTKVPEQYTVQNWMFTAGAQSLPL